MTSDDGGGTSGTRLPLYMGVGEHNFLRKEAGLTNKDDVVLVECFDPDETFADNVM